MTYDSGTSTFTLDLRKFLPNSSSLTNGTLYINIENIYIRQWDSENNTTVAMPSDWTYSLVITNCGSYGNEETFSTANGWDY